MTDESTAQEIPPTDEENESKEATIANQLLRLTDDFHSFLGEQDFFHACISSLFDQDDCGVLNAGRQKRGLHCTSKNITEKGRELAERLDGIRCDFSELIKQLG